MARIDVSKIEGFEEMSAEEKIAALTGYEFPDAAPAPSGNADVDRYKAAVTKANAEAAEYKRQLREKQTEAERAAADAAETARKVQEELAQLRAEKAVAGYKAKYLGMGYSDELATSTAEALQRLDLDTVFANQAIYNEEQRKAMDKAALNNQPGLTPGQPPKAESPEDATVATFRKYAMGG